MSLSDELKQFEAKDGGFPNVQGAVMHLLKDPETHLSANAIAKALNTVTSSQSSTQQTVKCLYRKGYLQRLNKKKPFMYAITTSGIAKMSFLKRRGLPKQGTTKPETGLDKLNEGLKKLNSEDKSAVLLQQVLQLLRTSLPSASIRIDCRSGEVIVDETISSHYSL